MGESGRVRRTKEMEGKKKGLTMFIWSIMAVNMSNQPLKPYLATTTKSSNSNKRNDNDNTSVKTMTSMCSGGVCV